MQQKVRILIMGVVLVTASLFGVYWLQTYLQRSRASATAPTASFVIAGPKVNPGDSFNLTLQINPNLTPFFSFDLAFTYDSSKIEAGTITPLSTKRDDVVDVQLMKGKGTTSIDTNTHTIRVTGFRTNGSNDPFTGRDPLQIVNVSFIMKGGQSLPLEFKWIDPDPAKITISDSFEKKNLIYQGEEPTTTTATTTTTTGRGGGEQFSSLTPVPTIMGSSGQDGTTTAITEGKDLLYINSIASYQSPFRYEQSLKLEKGTYSLRLGAKIYVRKERGVAVVLICNETTCGSKKKNEIMYVSPLFPVKTEFSEMQSSLTIPDDADNKSYILRVFCEDGSECELDYIFLEDAWGSERLKNNNFAEVQTMTDPRRQPVSWEVDATANLYGSIDPLFGIKGALMINNSAK